MRHPVAAKEQRVLPLTHQRADETLRNGIVDAVATVFQVSEYLIPEALQVIDRLSIRSPRGGCPSEVSTFRSGINENLMVH